jgi:hypothetical protein
MADALSLDARVQHTVTETLSGGDISAPATIPHDGYNRKLALDAATDPNLTAAAYEVFAMTGGVGSIDLTSLTLNGNPVALTGLKPRTILVTALDANSAVVTVKKGVTNGYPGFATAFLVDLPPGASFQFQVGSDPTHQLSAVGSSAKTLDLAGSGTDGVQVSISAGS